ncbi:PilW family protein [Acidithiobacillus sulfurivorans]|uniref:Prepilin-type N-terminal cleavage/methylation domain-containing protein n=1 Tax=Acidithiobacillus sulfurivorans TaxID=1958756 RepID=A0ABS6A2W5_9PROT|nr:PilW family protein [Acidithiobacillus sulfurivorans]MBU2761223.1 prepilin-type N-terminal cleavage/methylation domain-containing protein [Acidithiobacillus sulfurivorans]
MNRLSSSQHPNVGCHENGLTLVELLVSLVVVGLLATAVFTFFLTTSQSVSQQSASGEMWQRGRNALAIMRQAIESAGYGLPSYTQCPNGVVGYSNTGNRPLTLTAITASVQSTGYTYGNPYTFSTVIGGGSFGGAPATTVASLPNLNSASLQVNNSAPLEPGDMALIVPASSGGTCIFGEISTVGGSGSCNGNGNGGNGGNGTITMNSGGASCAKINTNQIFSQLSGVTGSTISAGDFTNAPLYDLGNAGFVVNQFQILDTPPGSSQVGTPTLYLTQYTTSSGSTPTPQALAIGVVDLQIQYGVNTNGVITWITPNLYTPSTQSIVAVQIAMLIRSSQYLPNTLSPETFNVLGTTYTVPSNGPGCLQGSCRNYEYHLFQDIIPVRNQILQDN